MTTKSSSQASTPLGTLANEVRLACMRISRRVRFESTDVIAPHQFSVMARLEDAPRTSRELAGIERVSAPSMSRTVAGLVERGFVLRQADPTDGRQVILSLTPEGLAVLKDSRRRRDQWMAVRLKNLPAHEREILARAAEILSRVAGE